MTIMPTPYFYLVKDGDSASSIADRFVKDPNRWPELVQANINMCPTRLVAYPDGQIIPTFAQLSINQRLYLPLNWLGASDERETELQVKDYGYSFDIYRHILNPRDWSHSMPFDYLLIRRIFDCIDENQYQPIPDRKGETTGDIQCGEPYLFQYYYNDRVRELWGANLDKQVVIVGARCGQESGFYQLDLKPCDIVKIPINWPDPPANSGIEFSSTDNLSKYKVPLLNATPDSCHKLCVPRRNNKWARFWTAERNTTDFTGFDAIDMVMGDSYSPVGCSFQRFNDKRPFLSGVGQVLPTPKDLEGGQFEVSETLNKCTEGALKSVMKDPDEYDKLVQRYGSEEALVAVIVERCKQLNKDQIDAELSKNNPPNSFPWLPVIGAIGGVSILGAIAYSIGKSKSHASST